MNNLCSKRVLVLIFKQSSLSLNRCPFIFLRTGGASSAINEEFWIEYLRNMAMVYWKVKYTSTLDEGQLKRIFLKP